MPYIYFCELISLDLNHNVIYQISVRKNILTSRSEKDIKLSPCFQLFEKND